jgi:hypothetical protein
MTLSRELVEIVACPKCKGPVKLKPDESGFVCEACRLVYPVVDEIPNFLVDEAVPLDGQ